MLLGFIGGWKGFAFGRVDLNWLDYLRDVVFLLGSMAAFSIAHQLQIRRLNI